MTTPKIPDLQPAPLSRKQAFFILFGLLVGVFSEALESSIIAPALPDIIRSLPGSNAWVGWVYGAYLLPTTVLTPIYGRLSDFYGRMPLYLWGMTLFMLGSILSGLATSLPMLVMFRGIQGIGAGAMMPIAIVIGRTVFPMSQRGRVQGTIAMAFGLAAAIGPMIGGVVTKSLGWHWLFFLNVPFCITSISVLYLFLPESARKSTHEKSHFQIDWVGAISLVLCAASLMLALTWIGKSDHGSITPKTWAALFISAIGFVLFLLTEKKHPQPMIPMQLFQKNIFSLCMAAAFVAGGLMLGVNMHLPLYMREVLHINASKSGVFVTPMILGTVLGSFLTGRLLGNIIQRYKWLALVSSGCMLLGLGMLTLIKPDMPPWKMVSAAVVFCFGVGVSFPLYGTVVGQHVDPRYLGISFGLLAFSRSLGGAVSSALFGSLFVRKFDLTFSSQMKQWLPVDLLSQLPLQKLAESHFRAEWIAQNGDRYPTAKAALENAARVGYAEAIHGIFVVACIVGAISLFVNAILPNQRINLSTKTASLS